MGLPWWLRGKESACDAGTAGDIGSIPGSARSPGEGNGNQLQELLPGKFHGQRSLVGYSPCGCKESDTTERLHFTSLHKELSHNVGEINRKGMPAPFLSWKNWKRSRGELREVRGRKQKDLFLISPLRALNCRSRGIKDTEGAPRAKLPLLSPHVGFWERGQNV